MAHKAITIVQNIYALQPKTQKCSILGLLPKKIL